MLFTEEETYLSAIAELSTLNGNNRTSAYVAYKCLKYIVKDLGHNCILKHIFFAFPIYFINFM